MGNRVPLFVVFLSFTQIEAGKTLADSYKPQTAAYLARMMDRPGWRSAVTAQDDSELLFRKAHPASSKM